MTLFLIIWMTWLASEIILTIIVRSGRNDMKGRDKNSIRVIWLMIALAVFSGVFIGSNFRLPIWNSVVVSYAGLVIIGLGMMLRFFSILTLGRLFTVDVTIRNDHSLKKDGIYGLIRHPSYTGSLLSFTGFGISLNNWLSTLIIIILVSAGFIYRIKIEEKVLIEQFGADYLEYRKKTYCLIPWLF